MITEVKTKATIQEKGITLIALVITIVVLIILATVTISFVFGEDGLIARAEQAAEMTEAQNILEQMELAKAEVAMENGGKVDVDDFFNKLEENGVIGSVENDVVDNGDGSYTITTDDGYEFEITVTPDGEIEMEYSGKGEGPRIRNINIEKTSNSVTITVETKNAEGGKYTYSYKKNSEGEESWQEVDSNTTSNTCTISNLETNEIYNIKVTLEVDGVTIERTINVQVGEMPQGTVNFNDYVWQGDGTASIVINTTEIGYTLQYQVVSAGGGMPDSSSWTDINSGETITGLVYGDTVYGRLWDGTNESDYANATIDDDVVPQEATIQVETNTTTDETITATITMADNESGVDATGSKWVYNTTSTNIGIDETSYTSSFTTNPEEITLQATTAGTYYLHVLTKDVAGNKVEKISEAIMVEEAPKPGDPIDGTLAVGPQVAEGMTPVKYVEGTGWVKTTAVDEEWYNYGEKKWANVVLGGALFTTSGSYEVLNESASYSMLVWIPRYAYKITSMYHYGGKGAGNIDIVFLDTENKDKEGTDYSAKTTYPTVTGEGTEAGSMADYVVHPAFNWDGEPLAGFWVGKFETSQGSGNTIQIMGGKQSWRSISVNDIHNTCIAMNNSGNSYGLSSDDSEVDPHMMKNTEWGAVAYLSQSIYGKNSEVTKNSESNFYTGGGSGTSYRTNVGQSTTGDVTGIYDMSGGAFEYVAGYYGNGGSYASSLVNAPARYKDIYTSTYQAPTSGGQYGDAVYETSSSSSDLLSWYSDSSTFADSSYPAFIRGGAYRNSSGAGLFCYNSGNGGANSYLSFRVVVLAL